MSLEIGAFYSENIRRRDSGLRIWSGARYGGAIVWEIPDEKISYRLPSGGIDEIPITHQPDDENAQETHQCTEQIVGDVTFSPSVIPSSDTQKPTTQ